MLKSIAEEEYNAGEDVESLEKRAILLWGYAMDHTLCHATIISDFAQMWRESGHFKVHFKRLNA